MLCYQKNCERHGNLKVIALESESRFGFKTRADHGVMFLGKTLLCHSAVLYPGVEWVLANCHDKLMKCLWVTW